MRVERALVEHDRSDADQREAERLAALDHYDVLDTPFEDSFDRITRLIRNIFCVPIAVVSLVDAHRQWHKAAEGVGLREFPLKDTVCRYAVGQGEPLIVCDAHDDARFAAHPMVTGEPFIRSYAGVQMRTAEGHNIGTVCAMDSVPRQFTRKEIEILADLAQLAMDELELRALAATDALTRLFSRRAFKEAAARVVDLAIRHKHDLSCIVFDLDRFKSINDTYGHAAGDQVLIAVAAVCREHLRKTDIVGRLGGEEFAVVLPHTNLRGALEVAEKLRSEIEKLRFDFKKVNGGITGSFGVTQLDRTAANVDFLLTEADAGLYEAKSSGKNRCVARRSAEDIRRSARRRVLKAGRVLLNNRHSVIDCTVRSLAEDGAGIDVSSTSGIPDRFILSIPSDRFEGRCRVISQTDKHIEVEFS